MGSDQSGVEGYVAVAELEWSSSIEFTIDGVRFKAAPGMDPATPGDLEGTLVIWKSASMIKDIVELLAGFRGGNIIELGIFTGGSVALTAMLAEPRRLVALDNSPARTPQLAQFIEHRRLADVVRPYYEVDQGDATRLCNIVSAEFGDVPLDLVFDDASHVYGPTLSSFETLFPRLRAGGVYVIEDWPNEQGFIGTMIEHREGTGDPEMAAYVAALSERLGAALHDPSDKLRYAFARFLVDAGLGHLIVDDPAALPSPAEPIGVGETFVPLIRLVHQLVLVRGEHHDLVRSIHLGRDWAVIERGSADLPLDSFRLANYMRDDFGILGPFRT
jgi:hypothetical protein